MEQPVINCGQCGKPMQVTAAIRGWFAECLPCIAALKSEAAAKLDTALCKRCGLTKNTHGEKGQCPVPSEPGHYEPEGS